MADRTARVKYAVRKWLDSLIGFHNHCICAEEDMRYERDGKIWEIWIDGKEYLPASEGELGELLKEKAMEVRIDAAFAWAEYLSDPLEMFKMDLGDVEDIRDRMIEEAKRARYGTEYLDKIRGGERSE